MMTQGQDGAPFAAVQTHIDAVAYASVCLCVCMSVLMMDVRIVCSEELAAAAVDDDLCAAVARTASDALTTYITQIDKRVGFDRLCVFCLTVTFGVSVAGAFVRGHVHHGMCCAGGQRNDGHSRCVVGIQSRRRTARRGHGAAELALGLCLCGARLPVCLSVCLPVCLSCKWLIYFCAGGGGWVECGGCDGTARGGRCAQGADTGAAPIAAACTAREFEVCDFCFVCDVIASLIDCM